MELLTCFIILLTTATCVHLQTPEASDYRLPPIYKPRLYLISLKVPPDAFTPTNHEYQGDVSIKFTVTTNTSVVELHANYQYLTIQAVSLGTVDPKDVFSSSISHNNVTEIMKINFQNDLIAGTEYTLDIQFSGRLSTNDMLGFYKSSYTDSAGTTKYLATTQFEPTSARRAFPCFDEPALKAEFDIKISYPMGMTALSNTGNSMPLVKNVEENLQVVQFDRTPIMSTYLIAFIISDFDCSAVPTKIDTVDHRICSRQEASSTRAWAEEIGPKLLASLNNYTQINYGSGIAKLDQVAIPDFSAGAMENWGLVTYREAYLLWDSVESSNQYKQYVATTIAHELAHQWFGNLVTMKWWSELFLNEGFATYFEYFTTHDVLPTWELDKQYVINVVQNALRFDVLESIAPLQSNVSTQSEATAKFNTISYHKGGSIFRMIEHIIGTSNFRSGLQAYLSAHKSGNTEPEDLWKNLNDKTNATYSGISETLDVVVDNWIKNPGFPLVKATLNGSKVTLTQSRFLLSGKDSALGWFIPISFTTSSDTTEFASTAPKVWLRPDSSQEITLPESASWIILNNQMTGFFRVNYDETLWNRIGEALASDNFGHIHELNRAQIVDDLFNLARTNHVQYSKALQLVEFLANDTSYYSWTPAFNGFSFLLERVGQDSVLGKEISSKLLSTMDKLYKSTPIDTLNEDDQIYTLKQVLAHSWACSLGHQECIQKSNELFSRYKAGNPVNKNLRSTVYCTALRHSTNSSDWEFLWNEYSKATVATEQSTILNSLGCSMDETLLERYLEMTLNDTSGIRSQDRYTVFISVLGKNLLGVEVATKFLINKHTEIIEKYQSMNSLTNMLTSLVNKFTTQEQIDRLKNVTESADLKEFGTIANAVITTAEANLEWVRQFEDDLNVYYGITPNEITTFPPNGGTTITVTQRNIFVVLVAVTLFRFFSF